MQEIVSELASHRLEHESLLHRGGLLANITAAVLWADWAKGDFGQHSLSQQLWADSDSFAHRQCELVGVPVYFVLYLSIEEKNTPPL